MSEKVLGGYNLLMMACEEGNRDRARLLAPKFPINDKNQSGYTALSLAIKSGYEQIARDLIFYGADVNSVNKAGQSNLFLACWFNRDSIVKFLLEQGADVNKPDQRGWTPLIISAYHGHVGIIRILLSYNCNIDHMDCFGKKALDRCKNSEISSLIYEAKTKKRLQQALPESDPRAHFEIAAPSVLKTQTRSSRESTPKRRQRVTFGRSQTPTRRSSEGSLSIVQRKRMREAVEEHVKESALTIREHFQEQWTMKLENTLSAEFRRVEEALQQDVDTLFHRAERQLGRHLRDFIYATTGALAQELPQTYPQTQPELSDEEEEEEEEDEPDFQHSVQNYLDQSQKQVEGDMKDYTQKLINKTLDKNMQEAQDELFGMISQELTETGSQIKRKMEEMVQGILTKDQQKANEYTIKYTLHDEPPNKSSLSIKDSSLTLTKLQNPSPQAKKPQKPPQTSQNSIPRTSVLDSLRMFLQSGPSSQCQRQNLNMDSSIRDELERYYKERQVLTRASELPKYLPHYDSQDTITTNNHTVIKEVTQETYNEGESTDIEGYCKICERNCFQIECLLRETIKNLSEKVTEYENQIKELRHQKWVANTKYEQIENEKRLHINQHVIDKEHLNAKIQELQTALANEKYNRADEIRSISTEFDKMHQELERIKSRHANKENKYNTIIHQMKQDYQNAIQQKDLLIKELKSRGKGQVDYEKLKLNLKSPVFQETENIPLSQRSRSKSKPRNAPISRRNSTSKLRPRRMSTPRRSINEMDELSSQIVVLEKAQAENQYRYNQMLKSANVSQEEVKRFVARMREDESKLGGARKRQEDFIRNLAYSQGSVQNGNWQTSGVQCKAPLAQ